MGTVIGLRHTLPMIRWLLFGLVILSLAGCYSKQEESEALAAADKVHSKLQAGDFTSVYQEAGPGFKKAMDESSFVNGMARL